MMDVRPCTGANSCDVTVTKRLEWTSSSGASSMRFRESSMSYIPGIWIWLGIVTCITLSALFAGLNLAIFSLSQLRLQIEADSGNNDAARASLTCGKILIRCLLPLSGATSAPTYF